MDPSLFSQYRAMRERAALVDRSGIGRLWLTGRDRASYLHGLLSQDITALGAGISAAQMLPLRFLQAQTADDLANPLALESAAALGLAGAIVSPELGGDEYRMLPRHSPLPLGIVIGGDWPLCVARTAAPELALDTAFRSPKGEEAWVVKHGNLFWTYPNWRLDLRDRQEDLKRAGYGLFVHLVEPVPNPVTLKDRPGMWNWQGELL